MDFRIPRRYQREDITSLHGTSEISILCVLIGTEGLYWEEHGIYGDQYCHCKAIVLVRYPSSTLHQREGRIIWGVQTLGLLHLKPPRSNHAIQRARANELILCGRQGVVGIPKTRRWPWERFPGFGQKRGHRIPQA